LWSVELPAVLAGEGLQEMSRLLVDIGAMAFVSLGPTPARMFGLGLQELDRVPWRAPRRRSCVVADGSVEVRRGSPEGMEVAFNAFAPEDPRFPLLPALSVWLRLRLATRVSGVEVANVVEEGCSRLLIRAPAPRDHPREILNDLRRLLRALPSTPITAEEIQEVDAIIRREATRWTMDGAGFSELVLERLAYGGGTDGLLHPPFVDELVLRGLVQELVAGRQGRTVMTEQERRARWEPPARLDNGVLVSVRWIPGEVAALGLAFGAVSPEPVLALLRQVAMSLSRGGWPSEVLDLAGIPAFTVAMPPEDVVEIIEAVAEIVVDGIPDGGEGPWSEVLSSVGLSPLPSPATMSVALLLPPAAEEATEAVAKFFSSLRAPGVEVAGLPVTPGLHWVKEAGEPRMLALLELPPSPNGYMAGEVLVARLSAESGINVRWLQPPGQLLLALDLSGEVDVPALDRRLAGLWQRLRRAAGEEEIGSARRRLAARFFGDMGKSSARTAAQALVADLPGPEHLAGVDARDVSAVLAGLARWEEVRRFAAGPAPEEPVPPSPPRRPAARRPSR